MNASTKFHLAVNDPFNPAAEGAKVPDVYSFPSETITFRKKFRLTSKASDDVNCSLESKAGFDCVLRPSLFAMLMCPQDNAFENADWGGGAVYGDSFSSTSGEDDKRWKRHGPMGVNNAVDWSAFRIVGGGARFSSLQPQQTTTGYINAYTNVITEKGPTSSQWETATLLGNLSGVQGRVLNIPLTSRAGGTGALQAPVLNGNMSEELTGIMYNAVQFRENGLEVVFRPTNVGCYDFKSLHIGNSLDNNVTAMGENTSAGFANLDFFDSQGWTQICVSGREMNPVDTASPLIIVELVLHVEYISQQMGVSSHSSLAPLGNAGIIEAVMRAAAKAPMYRSIWTKMATKKRKTKRYA